ncbi:uncharacterized protein LOC130993839 [Salvia miltiorrhiza]|uniref:uncharacterized protein LOC130993839 n=1 Tax=Salvia miltiorrhiza TaxID=226208 RepID=UPI0025ACC98A|nr:uncharacterized protein LOC130993839 [Salvia miltiorrhiza]
MFYMFICGRRSLSRQSTWKRSRLIGKDSRKRNPYAEGGLDKFHKLLGDVEEEKQQIYRQIGAENISFVRFIYSDSFKHVRPIVVRVKNNLKLGPSNNSDEEIGDETEEEEVVMMKMRWHESSWLCIGVMIVLVLVLVAIYGRSFAILCATVMWYLFPLISSSSIHHKNTPNVGKC